MTSSNDMFYSIKTKLINKSTHQWSNPNKRFSFDYASKDNKLSFNITMDRSLLNEEEENITRISVSEITNDTWELLRLISQIKFLFFFVNGYQPYQGVAFDHMIVNDISCLRHYKVRPWNRNKPFEKPFQIYFGSPTPLNFLVFQVFCWQSAL